MPHRLHASPAPCLLLTLTTCSDDVPSISGGGAKDSMQPICQLLSPETLFCCLMATPC